ncbi:MAG: hypothetical protein ACRDU4_05585 [Mycobacterium sp.]
MWSPRLDVVGATELVIATVKDLQLAPEAADPAFAQLEAFLAK